MIFWASLALTPAAILVHYAFGVSGTPVFVIAAAALAPLAFLIGEATEHVAEHTGPGIGGFLNASFGNAPELIIALVAIESSLPNVVRGSIAGSVVSNSLLVLGAAMIAGGTGSIDRRSLLLQIGTVMAAVALFLVPSVPSWHGDAERHALYVITLPVSAVLLVLYIAITVHNLRIHRASHTALAREGAWSLKRGVAILAVATIATAVVSELLVHSLKAFGEALGLSQFFIAVVIVALVGNAAEHGGAIVIARRGNPGLGAEIAISSATQVAVFVAPAVALLSFLVGHDLPLAFRPTELVAMGAGAAIVAVTVLDGRSKRWEGFMLLALYGALVVWFGFAGDR
jgi:Ca2+:H+ antiporter